MGTFCCKAQIQNEKDINLSHLQEEAKKEEEVKKIEIQNYESDFEACRLKIFPFSDSVKVK
jgi:hypothetical protein